MREYAVYIWAYSYRVCVSNAYFIAGAQRFPSTAPYQARAFDAEGPGLPLRKPTLPINRGLLSPLYTIVVYFSFRSNYGSTTLVYRSCVDSPVQKMVHPCPCNTSDKLRNPDEQTGR